MGRWRDPIEGSPSALGGMFTASSRECGLCILCHATEVLSDLGLALVAGEVLDSIHVACDELTAALARDGSPAPVKARYAAPHSLYEKYRRSRAFTVVARSDVHQIFIAPSIAFREVLGAELDQRVGINGVVAGWAGAHILTKEFERGAAARAGQHCVALNQRRVINPADHASIVSAPLVFVTLDRGRHMAMTALGDGVTSLLLDFDLGFQDVEPGFDEITLPHHSLIE